MDESAVKAPEAPSEVVEPEGTIAPLAWGPVSVIAGAVAVLLFATSGRYGYFADELYFVAAGGHLDWGYADQPPLLPLIAHVMDTLFPGSLVALRLPATVLTALGVVVATQIARELGGRRRAQVTTAAVSAIGMVVNGHLLATNAFDGFLWALVSWLVIRWVRLRDEGRRDDRPLLWAGVATAVALQVKFLIPVLWLALGVAALAVGPRDLPRRPLLWAGAAITVLTMLPGLAWQAGNGWPQFEMVRTVSEEVSLNGGRALFLPLVLAQPGLLVGSVLAWYGLWRLLRSPLLRPYRFYGVAAVAVITVFWLAGGRWYYVIGLFPVLWSAAAVELQRRRPARWWRWVPTWPVVALSALPSLYWLPVLPADQVRQPGPGENPGVNLVTIGQFGWPEFADAVGRAYRALPPDERRDAVVITRVYWQAAALEFYGPERGLPKPYSGSRGYWYFGTPPPGTGTVLYVGDEAGRLRSYFGDVRRVATVDTRLGLEVGTPVWLCREPRAPLPELWPEFRRMAV
ncbi:glycosyltransferase family 39 protein [Streptosporangium sp. NPDC002721]|uniref:glycosyltransferase family 39 protein n=1 Tax=Streptosporangium sp. NPDC002721 TaxID=3366188 RepID=UPI0036B8AC19